METENLTRYTRPQLAFSNPLRTVKVRHRLLKTNLRPSSYASFPISIPVFRLNIFFEPVPHPNFRGKLNDVASYEKEQNF